MLGFSFFGEEWTLEQDFYSWIYLIGLNQNIKISDELLKFDAFTDIEFNMEKSFNCQAYSAALYVSLIKYKKLDLTQIQLPLEFKKNTPKKSTLKPVDDEFSKLDAKKILEKPHLTGLSN